MPLFCVLVLKRKINNNLLKRVQIKSVHSLVLVRKRQYMYEHRLSLLLFVSTEIETKLSLHELMLDK